MYAFYIRSSQTLSSRFVFCHSVKDVTLLAKRVPHPPDSAHTGLELSNTRDHPPQASYPIAPPQQLPNEAMQAGHLRLRGKSLGKPCLRLDGLGIVCHNDHTNLPNISKALTRSWQTYNFPQAHECPIFKSDQLFNQ